MTRLAAHVSDFPHARRGSTRGAPRGRSRLTAGLLLIACLWVALAAGGAEAGEAPLKPDTYGYFDFPTCVRYALVHSERFLKTRLEIQVKSADVKDAHAEILPSLDLQARYYVASAVQGDTGRVNVQVYMSEFNPLLALIKIKSNGILVDLATTNHYDKIGQDIAEMGKLFVGIHFIDRTIRGNKQLAALKRNKVTFAKNRDQQGSEDPLELRAWANGLRNQELEIRSLELEREAKIAKLKALMGYYPDYELPLDTRDAINQVLGGFNGQPVSFGEIQANNLALKLVAKKEQLQSNMVTGAYVTLLPRPSIVVESIQNQVDRTSGFNFAVGVDYRLWDGFKRVREIKRQKMKARQLELDRSELSQTLYGNYNQLKGEASLSAEREGVVREQAKLAEIGEERVYLRYKAGEVEYDQYVDKSIEKVDANLKVIGTIRSRVEALIDLATLAGGLNRYNAAIRY